MTYLLSADPGANTGVALVFYDAITPMQLIARFQVHGGPSGFLSWLDSGVLEVQPDEYLVEKFIYDSNAKSADIIGVPIEGIIALLAHQEGVPVIWQNRSDKSGLIGYPDEATTKAQRQRVRFDFLDRCGMFKAGEEYTDSNDAIAHALISLKRRKHMPTLKTYWKGGAR